MGPVTLSAVEGQTDGKSMGLERLSLPAAFLYARSPGMQHEPGSSHKYHCCTARLNLLSQ